MASARAKIAWAVVATITGAILLGSRRALAYDQGKPVGRIDLTDVDGIPLERQTALQFRAMQQAAQRQGVRLVLTSGFRTMAEQERFWARYQAELAAWEALGRPQGAWKAPTRSLVGKPPPAAKPGYSNHQDGLAIDVETGGNNPESPAYRWLSANAARFGFENVGRGFSPPEFWHWERRRVVAIAMS